ncbi:MAG: anthranilate phosphoribosyltransferase [Bacteroidota bacterium]|nr:anthranilate phosphoribosyltransferase [Bacteroidota bacterium]
MKETLSYLFEGNILSQQNAKDVLTDIASGKFSEAEIASFFTVYRMRKITAQEILGFREAMISVAVPVEMDGFTTIDLCGTGGDGKNTFNISTLSSFVLAGAGAKVVKHGNYGLSSPCGSSNIMEYFGYQFSTDNNKLRKEMEECGICYLHAPIFHPAMKYVAPVRKALKVKTFFNMLGPMTNPARPQAQFVGVFSTEVQKMYAEVLQLAGIRHGIVHSLDGYDEISLTGEFCVAGHGKETTYTPESLGLIRVNPGELHGGDTIDEAADIFLSVLEGKGTKVQTEVVVANSAFALSCYFPDKSIPDCIAMARESLSSGKALQVFKKLLNK